MSKKLMLVLAVNNLVMGGAVVLLNLRLNDTIGVLAVLVIRHEGLVRMLLRTDGVATENAYMVRLIVAFLGG